MNAERARTWKKIGFFYELTMLFALIFGGFVLHAGKLDAGNYALCNRRDVESGARRVRDSKNFRGKRASTSVEVARRVVSLAGLPDSDSLHGALVSDRVVDRPRRVQHVGFAKDGGGFRLAKFSASFDADFVRPFHRDAGMIAKLSRALGEEIGWRGFLMPELAKVISFPKVGLISGLMRAVYHYPVLIFADYNAGAPAWYSVGCFTVAVVAGSFVMAWLTLRSQSLWPAAILHASHNLLVVTIAVAAVIVWRKARTREKRSAER